MAEVVLDRVSKVYEDGTVAVRELSLTIAEGEFVAVVGPSGCGKTTALRMIAGLERITDGEIRIGGEVVNEVPARKRDVAMVFQSYALYPDKSVRENLAFPLKLRRVPRRQLGDRVSAIASKLELSEVLPRKPRQLSGGQRQRVAMGRAIIREPRAFLMDEPLSNLDAKLRAQMRAEIALLHRDLGVTTVYVTHDQVEAMTLGDRVAVMRRGDLQQVDPPHVLYDRPRNIFVAGFIGSPAMNFVRGRIVARASGDAVELSPGIELALDDDELQLHGGVVGVRGSEVVVGVRPEHLRDAALGERGSDRRIPGTVLLKELLGADVLAHVSVAARAAVTDELRDLAKDIDEDTHQLQAESSATLVARIDTRSGEREGERMELGVAQGALRLFDPVTGERLNGGSHP